MLLLDAFIAVCRATTLHSIPHCRPPRFDQAPEPSPSWQAAWRLPSPPRICVARSRSFIANNERFVVFFCTYAFIKKSIDLIGMRWGNCTIRMSLEHKLHRRERKEGTEKEKIEGKFNPNFEYSVGVMPDGNRSKCL